MKKYTKLKSSEKDIQNSIIHWFELHKWFVWRNNSGMLFPKYKGKTHAIKIGTPGLPDLFAIKDGVLAAVEVKRPSNKPTPLQNHMLQELEDHGAWTLIAHNVEEVNDKFKIV